MYWCSVRWSVYVCMSNACRCVTATSSLYACLTMRTGIHLCILGFNLCMYCKANPVLSNLPSPSFWSSSYFGVSLQTSSDEREITGSKLRLMRMIPFVVAAVAVAVVGFFNRCCEGQINCAYWEHEGKRSSFFTANVTWGSARARPSA